MTTPLLYTLTIISENSGEASDDASASEEGRWRT